MLEVRSGNTGSTPERHSGMQLTLPCVIPPVIPISAPQEIPAFTERAMVSIHRRPNWAL